MCGPEGERESVCEVGGVLKELKSDQAPWRDVHGRSGLDFCTGCCLSPVAGRERQWGEPV